MPKRSIVERLFKLGGNSLESRLQPVDHGGSPTRDRLKAELQHFEHLLLLALALITSAAAASADDGVFVRFQLLQPNQAAYFVRLGGYVHNSPWYLPKAVLPDQADKDAAKRVPAGRFTPWFDLQKHGGDRLHGRLNRAGGVAEFPNVTADFVCHPPHQRREVVIELATAADPGRVVRRWRESFTGSLTSFLVSPTLVRDAGDLEIASEMTARRLGWAREATGGRRSSPEQLIVQTSFWSPQRAELNLEEAEVLDLLGFNVVGNQSPEVREQFDFRAAGHTHSVQFGPAATRDQIDALMKQHAERQTEPLEAGVPFGFSDEIVCRPPIGDDEQALAHFHAWLAEQAISPKELGVGKLAEVVPIETPEALRQREKLNGPAARRVFYYTSRFRQQAATERIGWHTEAFHRHFRSDAVTSTLVADHPYFAGSGLGMGMTPNPAWGNYPLAGDWFELARRRAVDLVGIEDWMGLQYMYGPNWTWEGFQLMGFQASIFRSAGRGRLPIIAWITPSDETNLRLKTASALCQGAKHFFYWTYGPTATSTENYWSDLRGAYDGIAAVTRQLAAAEHVLVPGRPRATRVALLYSISSDLWQPFGYVHMLERRGLYLSLVHDQYLVDLLSEEDVEAGQLADYDVLYTADPCIREEAAEKIAAWVRGGGHLLGTTAAGSRSQFNEPSGKLAAVFGIEPDVKTEVQPGRYHIRGALNGMTYLDEITLDPVFFASNERPEGDEADAVRGSHDAVRGSHDPAHGPTNGLQNQGDPRSAVSARSGDLRRARPRRQGDEGGNPPVERSPFTFGAIGTKTHLRPTTGRVVAAFADGSPAAVQNDFRKGKALCVGCCPAIAYLKEAKFVPAELKEQWPADHRRLINHVALRRGVRRLAELSHPVVECGVYDAPQGTALVLANFTYEPIEGLTVRLPLAHAVKTVRSLEQGPLQFAMEKTSGRPGYPFVASFKLLLGLSDVVLLE